MCRLSCEKSADVRSQWRARLAVGPSGPVGGPVSFAMNLGSFAVRKTVVGKRWLMLCVMNARK